MVRAEGTERRWGGTGQRPSCPQGTVARSQGKAFALVANGAWVPGNLGGGWGGILFLQPPPLTPRALTLKPCFSTRPPAKSLPQQLLARLEPSFLCECQALTLARSGPNTNQNQQKPSCINPNCPPHTYTHAQPRQRNHHDSCHQE